MSGKVCCTHELSSQEFSLREGYLLSSRDRKRDDDVGVPYRFTQSRPEDVDYKVMNTFLEFYITFLKFVFFKLYSDAGLILNDFQAADANAAFLSAVTLSKLVTHRRTKSQHQMMMMMTRVMMISIIVEKIVLFFKKSWTRN